MYLLTEGPLSLQWGVFHPKPRVPSTHHPSIVYFLLFRLEKVLLCFLVWAVWAQHTGP